MTKNIGAALLSPAAAIAFTFSLMSAGHASTFTSLYNFTRNADGGEPVGGVVTDEAGAIYGETYQGGATPCTSHYQPYEECGTLYRLPKTHHFKVLATFTGANGAHGNITPVLVGTTLYGATQYGGNSDDGVIFSVHTDGTGFTLLHQFNGADGAGPDGLVAAADGTLYGIAGGGGTSNEGVLFSLTPNGSYTVLYNFSGIDGYLPVSLIITPKGDLVGSTLVGGVTSAGCLYGCGTFFGYNPATAHFKTLYALASSGLEGISPYVGSVGPGQTIYGAESMALVSLNRKSGFVPLAALNYYTVGNGAPSGPVYAPGGVLYGLLGGDQYGVPGILYSEQNGVIQDIHDFSGYQNDGGVPLARPFLAKTGSLLGTSSRGGDCSYCGTIWEFKP